MRYSTIGLSGILIVSLLVAPLAADPQPPKQVPTIGTLLLSSPPSGLEWKQRWVFLQELRTLGWREGENVRVEYRWASGRVERSADLAAELVGLNVDVIVADNVALLRAVQHATTTIPIVMFSVDDPVAAGFIAGLARPGGNITGVDVSFVPELNGKLLEFLTEAVPAVTRIAVLVDPRNADTGPMGTGPMVEDTRRAARALGMQLHVLEVQAPDDFQRAFAAATEEGAGALLVLPSILFGLHQRRLAALALEHRLPAIFWQRTFAEAGGLLSYGPKIADTWRRVAYYVDRLLKGTKPADLPVERPTTFELVINLTTAQALGLTLPPTLLFQADEVLQAAPAAAVPRPPEVHITPPAADLPREVAAFSGTWEGAWDSVVSSRLVVESITADAARVVYGWADFPQGHFQGGRVVYGWADFPQGRFQGGWARVDVKVLPGGKLQWQSRATLAIFTFTMAQDGMSLKGEREEEGKDVSTVLMKKIGE